jgi:hypothetical protein
VYDANWYVRKVLEVTDKEAYISFMTKVPSRGGKLTFKWPSKKDDLWVEFRNILAIIQPPLPNGRSKRMYSIQDEDLIVQCFETK